MGRPLRDLPRNLKKTPNADDVRLVPTWGTVFYHDSTPFMVWAWYNGGAAHKKQLIMTKYELLQGMKELLKCHKSFATKTFRRGEKLGLWKELRHVERVYKDKLGRPRTTTLVIFKSEVALRNEIYKKYGVKKKSFFPITKEEMSYGEAYLAYLLAYPALSSPSQRATLKYIQKILGVGEVTATKVRQYYVRHGLLKMERNFRVIKRYRKGEIPLPGNPGKALALEKGRLRGRVFENPDRTVLMEELAPTVIFRHQPWFPVVWMDNKKVRVNRTMCLRESNPTRLFYEVTPDPRPGPDNIPALAARKEAGWLIAQEMKKTSKPFVPADKMISTASEFMTSIGGPIKVSLGHLIVEPNFPQRKEQYSYMPTAYEMTTIIQMRDQAKMRKTEAEKKLKGVLSKLVKQRVGSPQYYKLVEIAGSYSHIAAIHGEVYSYGEALVHGSLPSAGVAVKTRSR